MTIGKSSSQLSGKAAERQKALLDELEALTQQQLKAHSSALKQQLADVRRTTENATSEMSQSLGRQLEQIENRLSTVVNQSEKLSQMGGLRSWMRSAAITVAVMLTVGAVTAGGLLTADRLIDSRLARLSALEQEIERAESMPRLGDHLELRTIDGATYLIGETWTGTMRDGQPVIELTKTKD